MTEPNVGLGLFTPQRERLQSRFSSCFLVAYLEVWVFTTLHLCLSYSCCTAFVLSLVVENLFCWSSGGFPGGAGGKERDVGLIPAVGKIPWRRAWQPTPVFLPGESHGQRSLAGYSPWGHKELNMTEAI